jgi:hypothetical protein
MVRTGRAEIVTDPPASAGATTTGKPSPAATPVLVAKAAALVAEPLPEPANDPAQPSAAEPAK